MHGGFSSFLDIFFEPDVSSFSLFANSSRILNKVRSICAVHLTCGDSIDTVDETLAELKTQRVTEEKCGLHFSSIESNRSRRSSERNSAMAGLTS